MAMDSPFVIAFTQLMQLLDSKPKLNAKIERELLKAKNEDERVSIVAPLLRMIDFSPMSTVPEKSEVKSCALRTQGNKFYQVKSYSEAIERYNESIALAPYESNSKALALAFANRALVLKAIGDLNNSIADCKRALEHGYPKPLSYKIYTRLAEIYQTQEKRKEATENFSLAYSKLMELEAPPVEVQCQLERALEACCLNGPNSYLNVNVTAPAEDENAATCKQDCLNLCSSPSSELPAASNRVKLCHDATYGRHLVAAADIQPGDVLIVEKPHAAILLPKMKLTHCSHCFKRFSALLPCQTCSQVLYCSAECRDTAWNIYHEFECPVLTSAINLNPGTVTMVTVRVFALAGIKKLSAFLDNPPLKKPDKRTFDFNSKRQLDASDFMHIYFLETESKNRPYPEQLGRSLVANYLLQILELNTLPNFDKLGGFLLKISQSLSLHCFEVHEIIEKQSGKYEKVEIGGAVYAAVNMLNHSCDPNVMQFYQGSKAVVVATKEIPKGSQIFTHYNLNFLNNSLRERRDYFKYQCFFTCTCQACRNNWPKEVSLSTMFPPKSGEDSELVEAYSMYKDISKNLKNIQQVRGEMVPTLVKLIKIFDKKSKRVTKEYCVCEHALKFYYWKLGNYYLL